MKIAIAALLIGTTYLFYTAYARAVAPAPYKVVCHHNPGNEVTLEFANEQSYTGHLGTPHSDTVYDTDGVCVEVTPSVEPTEEVTPTPTVDVTPTATPSATPTPTEATGIGGGGGDGLTDGRTDGLSSCPECTKNHNVVVPATAPATGRGR